MPFIYINLTSMPSSPSQQKNMLISKQHCLPDLCFSMACFNELFCCCKLTLLFSALYLCALSMAPYFSIVFSMFSAVPFSVSKAPHIAPAMSSNSLSFSSNYFSKSLSSLFISRSSSSSGPSKLDLLPLIANMSTKSLLFFSLPPPLPLRFSF